MNCDPCEIPIQTLILIIGLAAMGISVALYGLAEDISEWWKAWKERKE